MPIKSTAKKTPIDSLGAFLRASFEKNCPFRVFCLWGDDESLMLTLMDALQKKLQQEKKELILSRLEPTLEALSLSLNSGDDLFSSSFLYVWRFGKLPQTWIQKFSNATRDNFIIATKKRPEIAEIPKDWVVGSLNQLNKKAFLDYAEARISFLPFQFTQDAKRRLLLLNQNNPSSLESAFLRLSLLSDESPIELSLVEESFEDESQLMSYHLTDALFKGELKKAFSCLQRLQKNHTSVLVPLFQVHLELRKLLSLYEAQRQGANLDSLAYSLNLWYDKKSLFFSLSRKLPLGLLVSFLEKIYELDQLAKSSKESEAYSGLALLIKEMSLWLK